MLETNDLAADRASNITLCASSKSVDKRECRNSQSLGNRALNRKDKTALQTPWGEEKIEGLKYQDEN